MRRRAIYALKRWRVRRKRPNPFRWIALLLGVTLVLFLGLASVASVAAYAAAIAYERLVEQLAAPETIVRRTVAESTKIYDRSGVLLFEIFDPQGGRRTRIPLRDIPVALRRATIATEDADFYRNQGFSLRGIVRAGWQNYLAGQTVEGGSTITQQLAKNVLIPEEERTEQSLLRKLKELVIAVQLTQVASKDTILETYLNEISYGNLAYGVEAAAQSYFGKPAHDLSLAESAMLAGIPQAPGLYSPLINPQAAKRRQSVVLDLMVRHGYITVEQAEAAKRERLQFAPQRFPIRAPHFVMYVRELLAARYGRDLLYRGGLQVRTSLDLGLQGVAESVVGEHRGRLHELDATNTALVAVRPKTGEILAMVGSADFFDTTIDGQVNVALTARQAGTATAPFAYLAAFGRGWTPATMVLDVPTAFSGADHPAYTPRSPDGRYHGPVTVRQALAQSLNVPATRALQFVGVPEAVALMRRLGLTTLDPSTRYGLDLSNNGGEARLLDLVYGYSVLANGGAMAGRRDATGRPEERARELEPVAILRVADNRGQVLMEFPGPERQPIVSPQLAYLLTDILADDGARAPREGAGSPLNLENRPAAIWVGRTETTVDAWTIGYVPSLAAGVWVGNSDLSLMNRALGDAAAAPIWRDFMERALRTVPPEPFAEPDGVERVQVCADSGFLPSPLCADRLATEVFLKGTAPTRVDDVHQLVAVDRTTGKAAAPGTPSWRTERRVALILPPEAAEWAKTADGLYVVPRTPTATPAARPRAEIEITSPQPWSYLGGAVAVMGAASGSSFQSYRVEVGRGQRPTVWSSITPDHRQAVPFGVLATWSTGSTSGQFTIRLSVLSADGQRREVVIPVVVDNTPPTVRLLAPSGAEVAREPGGWLTIEAEATDNFGIVRVDFVGDGHFVGTSSIPPYQTFWTVGSGDHAVQVYAYDRAGNRAVGEVATFRVQD